MILVPLSVLHLERAGCAYKDNEFCMLFMAALSVLSVLLSRPGPRPFDSKRKYTINDIPTICSRKLNELNLIESRDSDFGPSVCRVLLARAIIPHKGSRRTDRTGQGHRPTPPDHVPGQKERTAMDSMARRCPLVRSTAFRVIVSADLFSSYYRTP